MVLPLEVGGAAGLGLTQAAHPLPRAKRLLGSSKRILGKTGK